MLTRLTLSDLHEIKISFFSRLWSVSHRVTARGTEYPDNSVTSHLFSPGRRPDTAFQRYRNSKITGEFHSEITGRSLSECLDECLRQTSFQCRYGKCNQREVSNKEAYQHWLLQISTYHKSWQFHLYENIDQYNQKFGFQLRTAKVAGN